MLRFILSKLPNRQKVSQDTLVFEVQITPSAGTRQQPPHNPDNRPHADLGIATRSFAMTLTSMMLASALVTLAVSLQWVARPIRTVNPF